MEQQSIRFALKDLMYIPTTLHYSISLYSFTFIYIRLPPSKMHLQYYHPQRLLHTPKHAGAQQRWGYDVAKERRSRRLVCACLPLEPIRTWRADVTDPI